MQQALSINLNVLDATDFYSRVKACKNCEDFHKELATGITSSEAQRRLAASVPNERKMSDRSTLFGDIFAPCYILQVISILYGVYWSEHIIYTGILGALSIVTLVIKFLLIKAENQRLLTIPDYQTDITVHKLSSEDLNNAVLQPQVINSKFLAPGDLIEIQKHKTVPCNVILLKGICIVNESLLTGASTLVAKEELPISREKTFGLEMLDKHMLLAGTEVIETKVLDPSAPVLGVVLTIEFTAIRDNLEKEELLKVKKIEDLGVWTDLRWLLGILVLMFLIVCGAKLLFSKEKDTGDLICRLFEIICLAFVPALPTCFTIGQLISVVNFKRKGIFTRISQRLDLVGTVQTMCFEKNVLYSGESVQFKGVMKATKEDTDRATFVPLLTENFHNILNLSSLNKSHTHEVLELMATCHNLTCINGVFAGDSSDRKMFEATGWRIKESTSITVFSVSPPVDSGPNYYKSTSEVHVLKRFAFSHARGTMSVIVSDPMEGRERLYVKGVPEIISRLCIQETVPEDLIATLRSYDQKKGLEVIACATRFIEQGIDLNNQLDADKLQKDLKFLGLLVFDNKPNSDVSPTINNITEGGIAPVMFTGDNDIMRAISEAKKCGIIEKNQEIMYGCFKEPQNLQIIEWRLIRPPPEVNSTQEMVALNENADINHVSIPEHMIERFVSEKLNIAFILTGDILNRFCTRNRESTLKAVWQKTRVCINMSSKDKISLIKMFQKFGLPVGMCGNGVENCSALAAANVGISFNEATTRIATFISQSKDIKIVNTILKEGRCIMNNYTQAIRSMFVCNAIICYWMFGITSKEAPATEAHFLFQNVVLVLLPIISVFFIASSSGSYDTKREEKTNLSAYNNPNFWQWMLSFQFQSLLMKSLTKQDWYIHPSEPKTFSSDFQMKVLFFFINIQLFVMLCVFAIQRSFKTLGSNLFHLFILGTSGIISLLILFNRISILSEILDIKELEIDSSFNWVILRFAMIQGVVSFVSEKFILQVLYKFKISPVIMVFILSFADQLV